MKFWGQALGFGTAILLAACGGSSSSPQAAAPQLLAQVTTVSGVTNFSGNRANYTITKTSTGYTVTDNVGTDGTTNLIAPTRLIFADVGIAFDLAGVAGKAYRVYQAAFSRTPDQGGLGFWIYAMDQGASLNSVASGFMASDESKAKYGANPSNDSFVTSLYTNVLHRQLDQGGYDFWVGNLNNRAIYMPEVLAFFSESDENKAQVADAIANGITYTPYVPAVAPTPLTMTQLSACPNAAAGVGQVPQFYQCMVGTISGQTLFGNKPCTFTVASNGTITLAGDGSTISVKVPYMTAHYAKLNPQMAEDTYHILANAASFANNTITNIDIKATSPKYSAFLLGTIPSGMQVNSGNLTCKFAL